MLLIILCETRFNKYLTHLMCFEDETNSLPLISFVFTFLSLVRFSPISNSKYKQVVLYYTVSDNYCALWV